MTSVWAKPVPLDDYQTWALQRAYEIGQKYGVEDYLPAVLMKESSLCEDGNSDYDPTAYGCGQLHRETVKDITGLSISKKELLNNDELNIQLSAWVLKDCFDKFGHTPNGILCYNHGRWMKAKHGARWRYVKTVKKYQSQLSENLQLLGYRLVSPIPNSTSHPLLPSSLSP